MERIRALGLKIERAWQDVSYAGPAFPEIAAQALREADLAGKLSLDAIIDWALTTLELPPQHDAEGRFGQPPITLYAGRSFFISALVWLESTTTIHQHGFSGAFQVLVGSSLQTLYRFTPRHQVSPALMLGELASTGSRLLETGAVEPITGSSLIHSVFHLEEPSVSLVVRTVSDPGVPLQYTYLPPGVAYYPAPEPDWATRSVQLVKALQRMKDPRFEARVADLLARSDLHTALRVLLACRHVEPGTFGRLLARVRERHGALTASFASAFQEQARQEALIRKRHEVTDAGQRLFLALLLNVRSRREILELVRAYRAAGDPVDTVLGWMVEFSRKGVKLQVGGVPWEPNLFGLPELDDAACHALRCRLRDEPTDGLSAEQRTLLGRLARSESFGALFSEAQGS